MKKQLLIVTLGAVLLGAGGCALEDDMDLGTDEQELSILPNACYYPWSQIATACTNDDHVVGFTPECNMVCVPETAIAHSCNCKPIRYRWCRPGNYCILLYADEAPPSAEYQPVAVRYWCDQTGICPNTYWRIIAF